MIFVTVGTHEQQFNRLIKEVDCLKKERVIKEDVFVQTGYSDYQPRYCEWKPVLRFDEMKLYFSKADIIITHGGPSTFMSVLNEGKVPIVVPRLMKYGEHVNDHQLDFARKVLNKGYPLIIIEDISTLKNCIHKYQEKSFKYEKIESRNEEFVNKFIKLVKE